MPESNTQSPPTSTRTLDRLRQLLGDVVFLPCPHGAKGPRLDDWQKWTIDDTRNAESGGRFEGANIAVLLGSGLYAIDIDDDTDLETFLALNPDLRETFTVRGERGAKLIVRAESAPFDGKDITSDGKTVCEVLQGNATIAGTHPAEVEYRDNGKPAATVSWSDITWPSGWTLPGADDPVKDLTRRYGDPYKTDKEGHAIGFNERFWAGLFAYENDLIYLPETGGFWFYAPETGLFTRETAEALRERIGQRLFQAADDENRPEIRGLASSVGRLDTIVKALRGIAESRGFFDDRPKAIHVSNGMIFEGEDAVEFEESFHPKWKSRNRTPYKYQDGAQCPRFLEEFLRPMIPDDDDVDLLQRWAGICLLGVNLPQRILVFDGTPGRGKSVLAKIIRGLVGSENCAELRTAHLGERFELNRFVGKTLLVGSDVPGNFLMAKWASVLKSLVGGDYLTPEAKGSNEAYDLRGDFNVMIVSNSRLVCRLDGDVGAWRRRLMILRTSAPAVTKKVPDFDRVLLSSEGAGILGWALEGFGKAVGEIREHGDLVLTESQWRRVDDLLAESSAIEIFVRDQIVSAPGWNVTTEELEKSVAEFCADRGWNVPPITKITRELPDLMLREHGVGKSNDIRRENKCKRGFANVRVKEVQGAD